MPESEDQIEASEMLDELLDIDSGLSPWEVSFLDDLSRWNGPFTEKQIETIEKIHQRMFP